jgi:hypothetical protein
MCYNSLLVNGDPTRSKAGFSLLFRKRGLDGSIDRLFGIFSGRLEEELAIL